MTDLLPAPTGTPEYTLKEKLLSIEDVSLTLGTTSILKGVTGEVFNIVRPGLTQGQVVGLLGPSGRGKTQLSRILAGLQKPTSGRVLAHTARFGATPVRQGVMGMVMQHYPLLEHRTVMGNLALAAKLAGMSDAMTNEKVGAYLHRFGLEDRADHYPAQLSGGQRQRIAIIQQVLSSDNFIIMDEPFSGLDPRMKREACQLISEVASLNELMTMIIITHDIQAAIQVSDHLWMLGFDKGTRGGSKIQASYDLIERGLAWHPSVHMTTGFADCVREVTAKFDDL